MRKILVIDDHNNALHRMKRIVTTAFGSPDVSAVTTLRAARAKLKSEFFDMIVIDLSLPDGNGEDFIKEITKAIPNAYIVVSTIHDESKRLLSALENGATGYLLKEQTEAFLVDEFRGIQIGKPPMAPAITRRLVEIIRERACYESDKAIQLVVNDKEQITTGSTSRNLLNQKASLDKLTDRELEILSMLAKGFDRPEIAGALHISKHTVATHVSNIYSKLDIKNRAEAVIMASEAGLL